MFANRQLLVNALALSLVISFLSGAAIFGWRVSVEFEQEKSRAYEEIETKLQWILTRYETAPADKTALLQWVKETEFKERGLHRFELLDESQTLLIIDEPWPDSFKPILDLLTPRHLEFRRAASKNQLRIYAIFDAHRVFEEFVSHQWWHARIALLRMLLVLLVVGASFYFFFYRPVQGVIEQIRENALSGFPSKQNPIDYKPKKQNEINALVDPLNEAFNTISRLTKDGEQILEAVKAAPDACIICTVEEGDVIYANEAACKVTFLDEQAILRRKVWELSLGTDEASFEQTKAFALTRREQSQSEESVDIKVVRQVRAPTGAIRSLEVFVRLVSVSQQELMILHARDVSERNELLSRSIYSERQQAVSDLARGVAHELNNGFQRILGYAEVIEEEHQKQGLRPAATEKLKAQIETSAQLIQNLMTYSQQSTVSTGTLEVSKFVEGFVQVLIEESEPGVEFKLSQLSPGLVCSINPEGLEMALRNITENAVEASLTPCKIAIGLDVMQQTEPKATREAILSVGSYARITITDAGSGIATHLQTRVFDPFYSTKSLGQGLGLSSAQGFILQNDGAILLESQVGKGTTVSVLIPMK